MEDEDTNSWVTIDLDGLDDYEAPEDEFEDEPKVTKPGKEIEVVLEDEDEEDQPAPKEDEVRKSRAQERIQKLVAKEKEAKAELEAALQKIKDLEDSMTTKSKSAAETQKNLIDSQISYVKDSLRRAKEDGDVTKEMDLQERLSNLQVDKRIVEAQVAKIPAKVEPSPKKTEVTASALPEEMRYWLEDNAWALNPTTDEDRRKVRATRVITSELTKEGYQESEFDFYAELDARLKKALAPKGGNGVQYSGTDTRSSPRDVNQRKSPVSGSPRAPVSRRTRVSLSASENSIANKLNMDAKTYAKRKQALEESNGDWTVIN